MTSASQSMASAKSTSGLEANTSNDVTTLASIFHVPLAPSNLTRPPVLWTTNDVMAWVGFCVQEFSLTKVCVNQFNLNGKALLLLTRADFIERSPEAGDVLYNAFKHLSRSNGSSLTYHFQECLKSPIILSPAKDHSLIQKEPLPPTPPRRPSHSGYIHILPHPAPTDISKDDSSSALQNVPTGLLSPASTEKYSSDSDSCHNDSGPSPSSIDPDLECLKTEFSPEKIDAPGNPSTLGMEHHFDNSSETRLLWEFIYQLLVDDKHREILCWESETDLMFHINDPSKLAQHWGMQKNRTNMTYEKLSRALRYYYKMNIIRKVSGKKLTYQFLKHPTLIRRGQRGARPHSQRNAAIYGQERPTDQLQNMTPITSSIYTEASSFPTPSEICLNTIPPKSFSAPSLITSSTPTGHITSLAPLDHSSVDSNVYMDNIVNFDVLKMKLEREAATIEIDKEESAFLDDQKPSDFFGEGHGVIDNMMDSVRFRMDGDNDCHQPISPTKSKEQKDSIATNRPSSCPIISLSSDVPRKKCVVRKSVSFTDYPIYSKQNCDSEIDNDVIMSQFKSDDGIHKRSQNKEMRSIERGFVGYSIGGEKDQIQRNAYCIQPSSCHKDSRSSFHCKSNIEQHSTSICSEFTPAMQENSDKTCSTQNGNQCLSQPHGAYVYDVDFAKDGSPPSWKTPDEHATPPPKTQSRIHNAVNELELSCNTDDYRPCQNDLKATSYYSIYSSGENNHSHPTMKSNCPNGSLAPSISVNRNASPPIRVGSPSFVNHSLSPVSRTQRASSCHRYHPYALQPHADNDPPAHLMHHYGGQNIERSHALESSYKTHENINSFYGSSLHQPSAHNSTPFPHSHAPPHNNESKLFKSSFTNSIDSRPYASGHNQENVIDVRSQRNNNAVLNTHSTSKVQETSNFERPHYHSQHPPGVNPSVERERKSFFNAYSDTNSFGNEQEQPEDLSLKT